MELEFTGGKITLNPRLLPDGDLAAHGLEVFMAMHERGLELPFANPSAENAQDSYDGVAQAGEAETVQVPPDTKENFRRQLAPAFVGLEATLNQLNASRGYGNKLGMPSAQEVGDEFEHWLTPEKVAYVEKTTGANPGLTWTLIATPNTTITSKEFLAAAESFAGTLPEKPEIWPQLLLEYSPEEISGTDPSNRSRVKFKLVPDMPTDNTAGTGMLNSVTLQFLELGTQRGEKDENAFLEATSPLEDLVRLRTQYPRSSNEPLGSAETNGSFMLNFTLTPKDINGQLFVPCMGIDNGGLKINGVPVGSYSRGRISVG